MVGSFNTHWMYLQPHQSDVFTAGYLVLSFSLSIRPEIVICLHFGYLKVPKILAHTRFTIRWAKRQLCTYGQTMDYFYEFFNLFPFEIALIPKIDHTLQLKQEIWAKNCYLAIFWIHFCPNCVQMCIPQWVHLTLIGCIYSPISQKYLQLDTWFCDFYCLLDQKLLFVSILDT